MRRSASAVQDQFHVPGPLELLEDHLVHAASGFDERVPRMVGVPPSSRALRRALHLHRLGVDAAGHRSTAAGGLLSAGERVRLSSRTASRPISVSRRRARSRGLRCGWARGVLPELEAMTSHGGGSIIGVRAAGAGERARISVTSSGCSSTRSTMRCIVG